MLNEANILLFSFVMMRMLGAIVFNPILGRRNAPGMLRVGLALGLTLLIFPTAAYNGEPIVRVGVYFILLLKEFAMGYVLGFVVTLFLYVIYMAGELIDFEMGLSMAKIYDMQSNASLSLSATLYNALFILLFLAMDAHLALIRIFMTSQEVVPYGAVVLGPKASTYLLELFARCTELGVRLAFPLIAAGLLLEVGVGLIMRIIPQINVFVINIQAKVLMGLLMLLVLLSPMGDFLRAMIPEMIDAIREVLLRLR